MIDGDEILQDVCAANQMLNFIAGKEGLAYDKEGQIAKGGMVSENLLDQLNQWRYFHDTNIRSIGNEMIRKELFPMLISDEITNADALATIVEHIALQIVIQLQYFVDQRNERKETMTLLCTGGGVFNTYLIDVLESYLVS